MNKNQNSNGAVTDNNGSNTNSMRKRLKLILAAITIGILLMLTTLGLTAATLGILNNRSQETKTPTNKQSLGSEYADSIKISDVMTHLNEFQRIANNANGN